MYLVTVLPCVYLFASQHYRSTFTKLVTPRQLTFNLTGTISYDSYSTHVVIYIPIFSGISRIQKLVRPINSLAQSNFLDMCQNCTSIKALVMQDYIKCEYLVLSASYYALSLKVLLIHTHMFLLV